jgi:hypothetical protein
LGLIRSGGRKGSPVVINGQYQEKIHTWTELRKIYPNQWLVVEALKAHTTFDQKRHVEQLAVLESCSTGSAAMQKYRKFHQQYPTREFYFVHTSREELDIRVRKWLGVRTAHGTGAVVF